MSVRLARMVRAHLKGWECRQGVSMASRKRHGPCRIHAMWAEAGRILSAPKTGLEDVRADVWDEAAKMADEFPGQLGDEWIVASEGLSDAFEKKANLIRSEICGCPCHPGGEGSCHRCVGKPCRRGP